MSGLIQKTDTTLIKDTKVPALTAKSDSSNVDISFKYEGKELDKKTETAIKIMVMQLYPKINWDKLSETEKQPFILQYFEGKLQEKSKAQFAKNKPVIENIIKNNSPKDALNKILDLKFSQQIENFDSLDENKKAELRKEAIIQIIKIINPKTKIDDPEKQNRILESYEFTSVAMLAAIQEGKIDASPEKIKEFFEDENADEKLKMLLADTNYNYAKKYVDANPEILEKGNALKEENRALVFSYKIGQLERNVAEANGMTLEEYRNSADPVKLKREYLESKNELSPFEQKELAHLQKKHQTFGDSSADKLAHGTVEDSCLLNALKGEEFDLENLTLTTEQIAKVKIHINKELQECKTPEETKTVIAHILSNAQTEIEKDLYTQIFATLQAEGKLDAELYTQTIEENGYGVYEALMHSKDVKAEDQPKYARVAAKTLPPKAVAGYTTNIIPEYEAEVQPWSMKTVTDTGYQEVYDVLPETYAKLDEKAAKESYEYAMTSQNISAEQKAIIAKDTIDSTTNADLKKFYQDLAYKYDVDYNSVPPKSERVKTTTQAETNKTSDNIEGSKYSQNDFNNIVAQSINNSTGISAIVEAILETGNTILGNTSDPKTASITKITTVDSAIDMLKSGTSFAKVFNRCSEDVKKSFIKGIMQSPQKDTAIKYLLEKGVQFATLLKCAPTENAKKSIYNIATGVHISTVKTEVKNFAAKV